MTEGREVGIVRELSGKRKKRRRIRKRKKPLTKKEPTAIIINVHSTKESETHLNKRIMLITLRETNQTRIKKSQEKLN